MSVVIETTIGDITVDLYLKERPNACLNFLKLCKVKYYNLCIFHKVERNFIAQTGDPTCTGRGGESVFCQLYGEQAKYFDAEMKPRLKHEKLGTLSMVNNGNNMNASQFFLTLGENLTYLDELHTVFGEVTEGFEILLKLNEAICDSDNRPYQDIRITHTVVLHDPFDDPEALTIPDASPIPTREQLESNYIGADEEIDDTKGKNAEEIEEKIKESEAKARATILEMIGDLPDADVKPPENVLFVCKLNPVTTSEDLEIIFSRFGSILSCEVIKDRKSGESLQYAFIEFEKEEDCENAYFKMDNVLIDDRRIHVDFSQSVSKMNFNDQNKLLKGRTGRFQNYVIKDNEKKSDGYEMIFDMDSSAAKVGQDKRKSRDKYPEQREKHRKYQTYEHSSERDHRKSSSGQNYKEMKYYDDQNFVNKKSNHSSKISKSSKAGRQNKDSSISRSPSPFSGNSKAKRHDSSDQSDSSHSDKIHKKSYHQKKQRHDSNSSNQSLSPKPSIHQKQRYPSKDFHHKPDRNISLGRKRYSEISPEPSQSRRKIYKQDYTSKSPEGSYIRNKSRQTYDQKSYSRSPESGHRKRNSKQVYLSNSPEDFTSKHKSSKQVHYHKLPESSKMKKDFSSKTRQHSKSPESHTFSKSHHESLSSSPETSYQRSKATKNLPSHKRYHSRSPLNSNKQTKLLKVVQNRSSSSSSDSSKNKRKSSNCASSHSRTPEPSKLKKNTFKSLHSRSPISPKHKSRQRRSNSRSPSRSSELFAKQHKTKYSSKTKYNQDSQLKYEKLKSKSKYSKNLTEYSENSSSESDSQSLKRKSASSTYFASSSKGHSHKEHKRRKRSSS